MQDARRSAGHHCYGTPGRPTRTKKSLRYLWGPAVLLALASTVTRAAIDEEYLAKLDPILRQELMRDEARSVGRGGAASDGTFDRPAPGAPLLDGAGIALSDLQSKVAPAPNDAIEHRYACWIDLAPGVELPGLMTRSYGARATARLTLDEIRGLLALSGVRRVAAAPRARPSLDVSVPEIRADLVHSGSGAPPVYSGYAGAGIVIGIVDTGIDIEHEDFDDADGSRIHTLWDQTVGSINPPSEFGYGREWSQSEIENGSATETDDEGHGTHVAGTAAGNGAGTGNGEPAYQFVGVAPEATIIVVKTDFFTSSIVDAVDYVFQKADDLGLPAVVNLSLGHHYGPHDGTDDGDLAIDALVGPGRLVVAAAGNDQESGIHAEASIAHGQTEEITFEVDTYTALPGAANDFLLIDGYYTDGEVIEITVHTPNGHVVGPVSPSATQQINTVDGAVLIENDETDPATADRNFFIQVWDQTAINTPETGTWTIELENVTAIATGNHAQADCWIYGHSFSDAHAPVFVDGMTATKLVSSPATADSAIAVAAYTTRNKWKSVDGNNYQYNPLPTIGQIAAFSSHGPRRDGVIKPDLAAPGAGIGAALSADHAIPQAWILEDGRHFINQGTSMACPHVAGLVALMLESYGSLSRNEMLAQLSQTARADAFTGAVPNATWGAGKIDAFDAVIQPTPIVIAALSVVRSPEMIRISWSVPAEAGDLRFRIERAQSLDRVPQSSEYPYGGAHAFVGEVGPGPEYVFEDAPLLEFSEVSYWLIPLESGRDGSVLGPYDAHWRDAPAEFTLSNPAPNPFGDATLCHLALPRSGRVIVDVIDVAGRRVRKLAEGTLPAGMLAVSWDGRDALGLPSPTGIYWIRGMWNGNRRSAKVLYLDER